MSTWPNQLRCKYRDLQTGGRQLYWCTWTGRTGENMLTQQKGFENIKYAKEILRVFCILSLDFELKIKKLFITLLISAQSWKLMLKIMNEIKKICKFQTNSTQKWKLEKLNHAKKMFRTFYASIFQILPSLKFIKGKLMADYLFKENNSEMREMLSIQISIFATNLLKFFRGGRNYFYTSVLITKFQSSQHTATRKKSHISPFCWFRIPNFHKMAILADFIIRENIRTL